MPNLAELIASQRPLGGVRANFVVNADGAFVDKNGTSRGLSNEIDRQVLIALRRLSDVVITDASTARREHYRPSKWVPILVWSKSGNFSGVNPALTQLSADQCAADLDLRIATSQKILLETSPTLTRELADSIDELKLTVTGCATAADASVVAERAKASLGLEHLVLSEVYELEGSYFFTLVR